MKKFITSNPGQHMIMVCCPPFNPLSIIRSSEVVTRIKQKLDVKQSMHGTWGENDQSCLEVYRILASIFSMCHFCGKEATPTRRSSQILVHAKDALKLLKIFILFSLKTFIVELCMLG